MSQRSSVSTDIHPSLRRKRTPLGEASPNAPEIDFQKMQDDRPSKMARLSSSTSLARPAKRRLIAGDRPAGMQDTFKRPTNSSTSSIRPVSVKLRPPTPPRPHQPLEPVNSPPKRRQSFLPTSKSSFSLHAFKSDLVAPSPVPAMFALSPAPRKVPDQESVRRLDFGNMGPPAPVTPRRSFHNVAAPSAPPIVDAGQNPFAMPAAQQRSYIPTTPGGRRILGGISKFGQSPATVRTLPPPPSPVNHARPPSTMPPPGTPKRVLGGISRFNTPAKPSNLAIAHTTEQTDIEMTEAPSDAVTAVGAEDDMVVDEPLVVIALPSELPASSKAVTQAEASVQSTPPSSDLSLSSIHPEPDIPNSGKSGKVPEPSETTAIPLAHLPIASTSRPLPRAASRQSLASNPTRRIATRGQVAAQASKTEVKPPTLSALPVGPRRPASRPVNAPSAVAPPTSETGEPGMRRRPSYPSSLGLGAGPSNRKPSNSRVVSNPITSRSVSGSGPPPADAAPVTSAKPPSVSPRSVSAPTTKPMKPRASLSMSSRREGGFSSDANKSFVHLDQLLSKLQVMPERTTKSAASTSMGPPPPREVPVVTTYRTQGSLSAPARSRLSREPSTEDPDTSIKASSLEALVTSKQGSGCLRGITAFVDVRTEDGDDTSMLYVDLLKQCGARVLVRPSESCTHIVYKAGKPSTLTWIRKQKDPKPYIVGAGWVMKCKEEGRKVAEEPHCVPIEDECMFQKRRKSMEPKQLALMTAGNLANTSRGNIPEAYASSLAQARRKSLLYVPRVGSPLKKAYQNTLPTHEDD